MAQTPSENVLTLIAPAQGGLDNAIVASAMAALKGLGVETSETDWLSPGEACDIPFDGGPVHAGIPEERLPIR